MASNTAGTSKEDSPAWFLNTRQKGPSPLGTWLFTLLRLADLPLQYYFLTSGLGTSLIQRLGGTPVAIPTTSTTSVLGLSPYYSLVFSLAIGSAAKQIFWVLAINDNNFDAPFATGVAAYNTILNSLNSLLSLWLATSNHPANTFGSMGDLLTLSPVTSSVPLGVLLYTVGIWIEWWCEVQRKAFKRDPANKGKPYSGGLFSLATNINYGGYTLWRAGYSIVCAGLPWGVFVFGFLAYDFINRAIPLLEGHCERRVSWPSL